MVPPQPASGSPGWPPATTIRIGRSGRVSAAAADGIARAEVRAAVPQFANKCRRVKGGMKRDGRGRTFARQVWGGWDDGRRSGRLRRGSGKQTIKITIRIKIRIGSLGDAPQSAILILILILIVFVLILHD